MDDLKEQTYQGTYNVGQRAELILRNVRGGIEINGWDKPQVTVVAVKKIGTEWGAREAFDNTMVEMEQDGPRVRVRTRRPGGGIFGWFGVGKTPPAIYYTINVPATCDISVRTVDGKMSISDVIGTVYARTVGGVIYISRVSGQIMLSSVDASIQGTELGGTVGAKSVSGDAKITQSQLSSFWSKVVSGSVSIETALDSAGSYEMSSVDGSFALLVPSTARATAEMSSVSGRVTCELPCRILEQSRSHWRGDINGGGATISLHTVSGDLTILPSANVRPAAVAVPATPGTASTAPVDREWPEMSVLKAVELGEMTVEQAIAKLAELDKS